MRSVVKKISVVVISGIVLASAGLPASVVSVVSEGVKGIPVSESSYVFSYASAASQKKAAKKLIGKTCTRKYIQKKVGKPKRFVMSNAGCERGVYAGNFYYKKFTIHTRTYNKGKTFHVVSVN